MPTELEELVGFLHHDNPQIRQIGEQPHSNQPYGRPQLTTDMSIAIENLTGYSTSQPSIFKADNLIPVKDLKLLVGDRPSIAHNALTILINLSDDREVLQRLATDDVLLVTLLKQITDAKEPNADLIAMLFANMAKSDDLKRLLQTTGDPPEGLSTSRNALDLLMDCFVKGAEGGYNQSANFDHLAYLFADLAKCPEGRKYFTTEQSYDSIIPLTKLIVFTEHKSDVRRKGVASIMKNVSFDIPAHSLLMGPDVDILPYLLLPLAGPEEFSEEDTLSMLPDLQLLPPTKRRDTDSTIMKTHLETLLLLTTTRPGRELMRQVSVYPVVREAHLHVGDEGVREACDRLVQVMQRDEGEGKDEKPKMDDLHKMVEDDDDDDDDDEENKIIEIF